MGGMTPMLVFRWVFIPWLQKELDAYRERVNNTKKRADRNKVLPIGVPNDMFEHPEDYGVLDFKLLYASLTSIQIKVRKENIDRNVDECWGRALTLAREDCASDIELMPNLQPLANDDDAIGDQGGFYMGGVNNGKGLDTQQLAQLDEMLNNDEPQVIDNDRNEGVFAWFSDDEQEEDATADDW
ncbi:hypothetical protein R3P38DRAFT_2775897 [Favolaschia claudopus]|uniref:Uncharacterized protein n=1 Tax=Favolaschia claudopus TaxID=2862362 RepID=A0AAW0BTA9_9AGAR